MTSTNSGEPYALRAPRWRGFGKAIRSIEKDLLKGATPQVVEAGDEPQPEGAEAELGA